MCVCLALSIAGNNLCSNDEWVACNHRSVQHHFQVCQAHMHSTVIHFVTFVHVASYHWDIHTLNLESCICGIVEINQYAWYTKFPAMCIATLTSLYRTGKTCRYFTNETKIMKRFVAQYPFP